MRVAIFSRTKPIEFLNGSRYAEKMKITQIISAGIFILSANLNAQVARPIEPLAENPGVEGDGNFTVGPDYPKAPDLREPPTQTMSDGELFWVIHNGIRFTAMPAWGEAASPR